MISTLIASAVLAQADPVELYRSFEKGKTYSYAVRTHLQTENREQGLSTFIPSDVDINYDFNYKVLDVKNSGIARVHYKRPTMTQIDGETADRGPISTKIPVNYNLEMDVSPVNAITGLKDLSPSASAQGIRPFRKLNLMSPMARQDIVSDLAGELQRLALFVGSFDSSLDFAPKLPLSEVEVGETWRQTMSYQPMELKGSGGKFEMQRLDMDLKFNGLVDRGGKKVYNIIGTLKLDSDAAIYINQAMRMSANESGLAKLPLKLDTTVDFEIDPKTKATLKATTRTKGGWSIFVTGLNTAVQEEKITGRGTLTLVSVK